MKTLKTAVACVLLFLYSQQSKSQDQRIPINEPDYNKPKLFSDLPSRMSLNVSNLETLFKFSVGDAVSIQVTPHLLLEGTIVSTSDASHPELKSVVVRSTNRQGAVFTYTKRTGTDGQPVYLGRLMSRNNGDSYEIVSENGTYILNKKNLYDVISE